MAIGGAEAIGELAIKVVPDTSTFGKDVNSGVGTSVSKASGVALGAITAVGGGLIALGTQLDSAYDGIRIGTGATGDALKGLEDSFGNVAATVPNDLESVGVAIADLNTRLGLTGPELEGLAQQFLDLSSITETDVGTNIENVTGLFNQFNVAAEDQAGVLDTLFRASQASGASLDTLTNAYNKNGAGLEALGFTLEEGVALLATFEKNGIDAARGSAGLNKVLKEATDLGIPAEQALSDLADSFKNAGSDADAAALGIEVFGARGGPQLANAIRSGNIQLDDLVGNLKASTDSIGDVQDETADAAETFKQLKNQLAIALGPAANKLFSSLGEAATNAAPAIVMVVEALTPLIEAFASLPAPVLAVVIGALAVGATFGKIIGPIKAVIGAVKLLSAVLAANPYILLIAATIAIGILIFKNWDKISKFFSKTWEKIKGIFDEAIKFIKVAFNIFWKGDFIGGDGWLSEDGPVVGALFKVRDFFTDIWDKITGIVQGALDLLETITRPWVVVYTAIFTFAFNAISTFIETWIGRLQALFTNLFGWLTTAATAFFAVFTAIWDVAFGVISNIVSVAFGVITTIFTTGWAVLQTVTSTVWAVISSIVGTGVGVVKGLIDTLLGPIGGVGGALETMRGVFQTVWDKVKDIMQGAYDFVVRLSKQIGDAVKDALGPVGDIAGAVGGVLGGGARLLGFDDGGVVPGPKGSPRLILAHGGETVLPTHKYPLTDSGTLSGAPGPSQSNGGGGMVVQGPLLEVTGPVTVRSDDDIIELSRAFARETQKTYRAAGRQTGA